MSIKSRIRIGTVQFGTNYGITNTANSVINDVDLFELLETANNLGFYKLDTADEYGNINLRLNQLGFTSGKNFAIQNKVKFETGVSKSNWLRNAKNKSIKLLGNIDNILIHNGSEISKTIVEQLLATRKSEDLSVGLSIYSRNEFLEYQDCANLIIQIPFNIVNHRLMTPEIKKSLKCKIQVRSIFLQGLLLADLDKIPENFNRYFSNFSNYHSYVKSLGISKLEFNLAFALHKTWIDEVVVGIQNIEQLYQLNKSLEKIEKNSYNIEFDDLFPVEAALFDPRLY